MSGCVNRYVRAGKAALVALSLWGLSAWEAWAQTTWDGGGGTDTSWGAAANWNNDSLPAFNGADSLAITNGFGTNTALTLGADRSIGRLTIGGGATAISLSGNTLRLNSTTTTNTGAGTALWNASTADNVAATINSAVLLQSGSAGTYTGHIRENNNANGGTRFNGAVTQGAGESWTLRFSRANSRGSFYLNNAGNSISALRNDGADVYSDIAGAFGGASLTLATAAYTGTRLTDHYTTPVTNSVTVAANSTWVSLFQTRLTGALTQGGNALTYGNAISPASASLTRLEYSSCTGTGSTTLGGGVVAPNAMSQFASGSLDLGVLSGGQGVLVLSGAAGNGVPTWGEFTAARTFNQSGGAGNWRIGLNAGQNGNVFSAGGFAARGADLVIPATGGGLANTTFTRNFFLGAVATVDGARYASNAVIVQTDIAYGAVTNGQRYFGAAFNAGASKTTTTLTMAGPVHELSGVISGSDVIMYPIGHQDQADSQFGVIRISNASNSLTGVSRWILGGQRGTNFYTVGGGYIATPGNMADKSSVALIFTSDGAFGGATEVQVTSQGSSGSAPSGTLLLEDANPNGATVFGRTVNVVNTSGSSPSAAFGSYAGEVVYTGTVTLAGSAADTILHVQAGTLSLGATGTPATVTNNRTVPTLLDKSGIGVLELVNLTFGGTQPSNIWAVYQGAVRETATASTAGQVLQLRGGVLEATGTFSRSLGTTNGTVNWGAGGGGFAAYGGPLTVNLGGAGATNTWANTANFLPANAPLILGSETANNTVTFQNGIALNGAVRELRALDNTNTVNDRAIVAGVISGTAASGISKTGAGLLDLAAANTYTGATAVAAGTLLVNGSLGTSPSNVTVNAGGTLGGTGTINRAVFVNDGGILAPGNQGSGIMTVSNLTLAAGSTNVFVVGGATTKIAVNGNLTLAGTVVVNDTSAAYAGTHEVMTYSGGLTAGTVSVGGLPVGVRATVDLGTPGKVLVRFSPPGMILIVK